MIEILVRIAMTVLGLLIAGIAVGLFKHSNFGTDPFQAFAAGIHSKTTLSFGIMYAIINIAFLVVVFFIKKHYIGIGTIINLFLIGYIVEYSYAGFQILLPEPTLVIRIAMLCIGFIILCIGSSFYITADLGVSTYDAVALILSDKKVAKFQYCRIATDIICVIIGFLLGATVGVGTIMTAFLMGPFIVFFRRTLSEPMLKKVVTTTA